MLEAILLGAVSYGACIIFAAEGELIAERSGIVNLGTEGSMLTGALFAFAVTVWTGLPIVGAIAGLIGGALPALLHAYMVIDRKTDQLASGLAITLPRARPRPPRSAPASSTTRSAASTTSASRC